MSTARDDRFGFSLEMDDGDLRFEGGQFQVISGLDNLMQSLTLKVATPFGSDRFNTRYGLDLTDAFSRAGTLSMTQELIRLSLVRTIGSDPRVRDVRAVRFLDAAEPDEAARRRGAGAAGPGPGGASCRCTWRVEVDVVPDQGPPRTLVLGIGA